MKVAETQARIVDVADSNTPTIVSKARLARGEPEYRRRIEDLRGMAKDEGITVAPASIEDFWQSIRSLLLTRKAQLVLADEGNLIAIWDDDDGNYVDIEFLGEGSLHYVIFRGPENSPDRICEEGSGTLQTVKRQVQKHKLETLLGI